MRLIILSAMALLSLAACSKAKYDTGTAYGGLSFYNASYALDAFLPTAYGTQVLLPLTPDGKQTVPLSGSVMPDFASGIGGARQDFPYINAGNALPWMVFDHYTPGAYAAGVYLKSLDSASQLNFPVMVEKDKQQTYFLSDSLGVYGVTAFTHQPATTAGVPMQGKVRFRLLQLCPDADSVNMRIGNNLFSGLQNMPYRSVSAYMDYPLAADSTLKLRIFNAGDTLTVIARTDLPAEPGQSYVLILRNYRKSHTYTDKNGKTVSVAANGTLDVRKVE